ncbi:LamG-like jellyroll fold domain-containing protein [Thermoflexus sp.]|uniref:LamG-like jellyroll fold domain-containing protein n=1 Tax=Thermoflexus sp. TaxID=1969742 RepID=UPI0035E4618E
MFPIRFFRHGLGSLLVGLLAVAVGAACNRPPTTVPPIKTLTLTPCLAQTLFAGDEDNFSTPGPPTDKGQFDQTQGNQIFEHSFHLSVPPGLCVTGAVLKARLRPLPGGPVNDTITLSAGSAVWNAAFGPGPYGGLTPPPSNWPVLLNTAPPSGSSWPQGGQWVNIQGVEFTFNLANLPDGTGGFISLLPGMTSSGSLTVGIQDDTAVDWLRLEVSLCPCPPPTPTRTPTPTPTVPPTPTFTPSPTPIACIRAPEGLVAWWPLDETSGPTAHDIAGVPNDGTWMNGPTPVPGVVAGALRFDGKDDFVRVPDHPELNVGSGSFTIDAWVRTEWQGAGVVVLQDKRDQNAGYHLHLYRSAQYTGGKAVPALQVMHAGSFENHNAVNSPDVADGKWHHIAAVADVVAKQVRIYVDGKLVYTGTSQILGNNLDNKSDFYLGVRVPAQGGGGNFPGDLDEVELFKRALSEQEIQAIFNAGSAGKCKGQICVVKFEDLDGDGVQDPNEPPLFGWKFDIKDSQGNIIGTVTTDKEKPACRLVLAPGTYTVSEQGQPGWTPTTNTSQTVTVSPGQTVQVLFGNRKPTPSPTPTPTRRPTPTPSPTPTRTPTPTPSPTPTATPTPGPAVICVLKFHDLNKNGVRDPGEPLLSGWTFVVNGIQVSTNREGRACVEVRAPATYTVKEVLPPGWTPISPPGGSTTVTVSPGQTVTLPFANYQEASPTPPPTPTPTPTRIACIRAPEGLVAWWPLDETSGITAVDIKGGLHGKAIPGPIGPSTWPRSVAGRVASALLFGNQSYVEVPPAAPLNPGNGEFTVDAWIYYSAVDHTTKTITIARKMLGGGGTPSPPYPFNLGQLGPGYILRIQEAVSGPQVFAAVKDISGKFNVSVGAIPANQWVHVAMVLRRSGTYPYLDLYVNGNLVPPSAYSFPPLGDISNNFPLLIGGDGVESGELIVDEVEYFNRALTPQEIQAIFNAGSAGKCKG